MKKMKLTRSLMAAVSIVALTAVAYGCSSGVSQSEADRQAMEAAAAAAEEARMAAEQDAAEAAEQAEADRQAKIDAAETAINAAETEEAAQMAKDAVDNIATVAEADELQGLVDARVAALAMMAREADQKTALMTAAGMIDTSDEALSTQAGVDAARTAITGLRQALDDAADVSEADQAPYRMQLSNAVTAVDNAQGGLDTTTRRTNQMGALSTASGTLQTALAALSGAIPTQAQLNAANNALTALNNAIAGGMDLTDAEKATYVREAANAAAPIRTAQKSFDDADEKAEDTANAAMAVTAAKLYAGISAQMGAGDGTTFAATDRDAFYNAAGTAILVSIGNGEDTPTADDLITLSEDKMTMVAANRGWAGKRYADPAGGDMVEAYVYSNVEAPEMGKKFGKIVTGSDAAEGYEYPLSSNHGGVNLANPTAPGDADKVDLDITRTAGVETWTIEDVGPTPSGTPSIPIPGSYHGVSGTYWCLPTSSQACTATVAIGGGFILASQSNWWFVPSNGEDRVMESEDTVYASYGWWLRKAENDGPFTASAFVDERGTVAPATGLNDLNGTATYVGGAAGKYALSSTTGGTNDAGHFTARATLEANFDTNTATDTTTNAITGTIDQFIGADGMSRDWTVKLMGSPIGDTGVIGTATGAVNGARSETVWRIGETDAEESGNWIGSLRDIEAPGGVPQVATGTFYTEYNRAGKMVGAFGANLDED
ncbi:MAG: hypothetical protein OXP75_19415 [Rhodospirillales bacterium]|nr:hypothetical protein [Rhodospirillales bacterium]